MTTVTLTRKQQQLSEAVDAARERVAATLAAYEQAKDAEVYAWAKYERTHRKLHELDAIRLTDLTLIAQDEFQRSERQRKALVEKARAAGLGVELS